MVGYVKNGHQPTEHLPLPAQPTWAFSNSLENPCLGFQTGPNAWFDQSTQSGISVSAGLSFRPSLAPPKSAQFLFQGFPEIPSTNEPFTRPFNHRATHPRILPFAFCWLALPPETSPSTHFGMGLASCCGKVPPTLRSKAGGIAAFIDTTGWRKRQGCQQTKAFRKHLDLEKAGVLVAFPETPHWGVWAPKVPKGCLVGYSEVLWHRRGCKILTMQLGKSRWGNSNPFWFSHPLGPQMVVFWDAFDRTACHTLVFSLTTC